MRSFVAIGLDPPLRASLTEARGELEGAGGDVRWVAPELLHLTLKFLGELPEEAAAEAGAILAARAAPIAPFTLSFRGIGPFPNPRRPRVIAARVPSPPGQLLALADGLDGAFEPLGVARESRTFRAHLTLGRVRSPKGLGRLLEALGPMGERSLGTSRVGQILLMKSVLGREGPTYSPLTVAPLLGESASPE